MKTSRLLLPALFLIISTFIAHSVYACSSFKLEKEGKLVYGHNLNQGDIGVPGILFVNKRGIYKKGRSWSEIYTSDNLNPSTHSWISRYGSVTFNNFGKDFPDGGMNETGLFIWEMNEDTEYPKDENLPKLCQMNWMQYILDNCMSVEEAVKCAYAFEIDGWGWHYFVGDAKGNTAAIAFIKGEVVIHTGDQMPVPGLFNSPYEREMELLKYYKGYGGEYEIDLENPKVPRFVKTAAMIEQYKPEEDIIDYGMMMLDKIQVNDIPEWSILCDVNNMEIHFKTRINPEVKTLKMNSIDFSNKGPAMIIDMDIREGGLVNSRLFSYSNQFIETFNEEKLFPLLPASFFTGGGLSLEEFSNRIASHSDEASIPENQHFAGKWKNQADKEKDETECLLIFKSRGDAVELLISIDEGNTEFYNTEHLGLVNNRFSCTFITSKNTMVEVIGEISDESIEIDFLGIEDHYGHYVLHKTD